MLIHGHKVRHHTSATYSSWASMIARCYRPSAANFRRYGGAGITVCERWRVFANFLADMGERPEGLTLDRIDSDGNYEPGNCRWATLSQQMANRKGIHELYFKGRKLTRQEWAQETGIKYWTIKKRLARGWSVTRTLTERPSYPK